MPGYLHMLIGDISGTSVSSRLHPHLRYEAGPAPGWRHAVLDISSAPRSDIQYIQPIQQNYFMEEEWHHYAYWLDNITLRGWGGGCAKSTLTVLDEHFDDPMACDTTGWTITGDFQCPGFDWRSVNIFVFDYKIIITASLCAITLVVKHYRFRNIVIQRLNFCQDIIEVI